MSVKTVAIVGAGIAGLTAALSFARHGIACDIIEQAAELAEIGAGIQISPNAARILAKLCVLDALEREWNEPDSVLLVSGSSLRPLMTLPVGSFARSRWHAPYGVLHRATLQRTLLAAVKRDPLCKLYLGIRLGKIDPGSLATATGRHPDLIVGADGVWSQTRRRVEKAAAPSFSGNVAWRFTVGAVAAPAFLQNTSVVALVGGRAHLVAYPLRETGGFNVVAIASGANTGHTWLTQSTSAQKAALLKQFHGWNPAVVSMLDHADAPNFWPLYQVPNTGRWHNGRDTVLIGDAAHAMMPFAAQGAALAIEDAFELAHTVSTTLPLAQALATFETLREPRVARARSRASMNRFAYHARGPLRLGRNLVFALRPPQAFAADLDWLYGYQARGL